MSTSTIFLITLALITTIFVLIDNNVFKFSRKKTDLHNAEGDDYFEIKKSFASIFPPKEEPNIGEKKEEERYLENGKKILADTSFYQIQNSAMEELEKEADNYNERKQ